MVTTVIQKWGNSRAVRIPKDIAVKLGLNVGQEVEIGDANGQLVIRPAHKRSRYRLADLLKGCHGKKHPDPWPTPVGKELI